MSALQFYFTWVLICLMTAFSHLSWGQSDPEKKQNVSIYQGQIDRDLTIRKIAVLPVSDNVNGIYSRPMEKHLATLVDQDHRWELIEINPVGPILTPEDLRQRPELVSSLSSGTKADALLASRITKGTNGLSIQLNLFLTKDRRLLSQESLRNFQGFETKRVKEAVTELFEKTLRRIPYTGLVLSRQGTRVTINLGKKNGLVEDQTITVIQIIKANRHPKFNFLISTEKEILGRIRILKVDETLSFGRIVTEKSKGAIQRHAKISGVDFINYADSDSLSNTGSGSGFENVPGEAISFGKNPREWKPKKSPKFGSIGARFGLGSFEYNMNLDQIGEDLSASAPLFPSIALDLELWMSSQWTLFVHMSQGIIQSDNPKSDTETKTLSYSLTNYELLFGYTFRFGPSTLAPRAQFISGFSSHRVFVDDTQDSSGNRGLTTLDYSGFKTGIDGRYPVSEDGQWAVGAQLFFYFFPALKETPVSSGNSENTINQFAIYGEHLYRPNILFRTKLDFELYSTSFNKGRASSSSQKFTTLWGGVHYLF